MKKIILLAFLVSVAALSYSQDIKVISKENSGNTIINFKTTNGTQVPIFRPMGQMDFDAGSQQVILKKVQEIGSAPLSLELNNGYYTFQLYDAGPKFKIDAQGGTQDWMIKPGKKGYFWFGVGSLFSALGTASAAGFLTMTSDTSSPFYDEGEHMVNNVFLGVAASSLVINTVLYFVNKPKAKMVNSY